MVEFFRIDTYLHGCRWRRRSSEFILIPAPTPVRTTTCGGGIERPQVIRGTFPQQIAHEPRP
jgi:hypothetical protein